MFSNVICLHLRRFKKVEELEDILISNELTNIDAEACFNLMLEGYTKLFIDRNTYKIIGYCHATDRKLIQISEDFILYLKTMNSISYNKPSTNLKIDSILDKINEKGMESLTKQEKEFLNNNSSNK